MSKTYISFVQGLILKKEIRKPIYVRELSKIVSFEYNLPIEKATAAVSVALKRIMDSNMIPELKFYQKGIYYRTVSTPFGNVGIDKEQLIQDKYLYDDNGYESGFDFLYKLGLSTQIPNKRVLITNKAGDCARIDKKLNVVVRPPKIEINKENKQYLKVLDVLDIFENAPIDVEEPYGVIRSYISQLGLEYSKLLAMANNYYNKNTILQLGKVAGGLM